MNLLTYIYYEYKLYEWDIVNFSQVEINLRYYVGFKVNYSRFDWASDERLGDYCRWARKEKNLWEEEALDVLPPYCMSFNLSCFMTLILAFIYECQFSSV